MPREKGEKVVATNRKARHDYTIIDTLECGIVLWGTEVKSLREGRASLVDGYAFFEGGQAYLDAVHIPEYHQGTWNNHAPRRKRKLLMHKREIEKWSGKVKDAGGAAGPVKWNFEKFLVLRDGTVKRFRPTTKPDDPEIVAAIEADLAK